VSKIDELKERLAKANAEKAEHERAIELDEAAELEAKVEAAERAAANARAIREAVEKHGPIGRKIAVVETPDGAIVLKKANHIHFKRFQDAGELTTETCDTLVRPCVVYPSSERFDALLEEYPAVLVRCADAVTALAGARSKEVSGKS
jgi:hypothetical protein